MRTVIRLRNRNAARLPKAVEHQEIRYSDDLVAAFVREFTKPGQVVFDPFAGFGTTLVVAETLGRYPSGVELEPERAALIRSQLRGPHTLVAGDARRLDGFDLPAFDLLLTAPPFMRSHEAEDALSNWGRPGEGFAAYLDEITGIFASCRRLMNPGAKVVVEVANLKDEHGVTTLAWELGLALRRVLRFEGEVVVDWDRYDYGYDHSYCLVFRAPDVD